MWYNFPIFILFICLLFLWEVYCKKGFLFLFLICVVDRDSYLYGIILVNIRCLVTLCSDCDPSVYRMVQVSFGVIKSLTHFS